MCACVIHRCGDVRCPHRTTTTTPRMWLQAHLGLAGPRRRLPGRYLLLPLLMRLHLHLRAPAPACVHGWQRMNIHAQRYTLSPSQKEKYNSVFLESNDFKFN